MRRQYDDDWYPEFTQRLRELIERRKKRMGTKIEFTIERTDDAWELTLDGKVYVYERLSKLIRKIEAAAERLDPETVAAAGGVK